jgi:acetyl esterase/lipase
MACGPVMAQQPGGVLLERDIVYARAGGQELRLNLARPAAGAGPFPLIVCIHGGGWQGGDKNHFDPVIRWLAQGGYVAATVQYRLAPQHRFPAQLDDAQAAVRYLRARANQWNIDPDRVGALGVSAGGHLALLLGLMDDALNRDGPGGASVPPSKVQAVVNYFGPSDLRPLVAWAQRRDGGQAGSGAAADLVVNLLGTRDARAPIVSRASPVTHISGDDPPVLTFHGTHDGLVPLQQSAGLHEALRAAGVTEQLVIIEGAGHGWGGEHKTRTDRLTREFFDRHLKRDGPAD